MWLSPWVCGYYVMYIVFLLRKSVHCQGDRNEIKETNQQEIFSWRFKQILGTYTELKNCMTISNARWRLIRESPDIIKKWSKAVPFTINHMSFGNRWVRIALITDQTAFLGVETRSKAQNFSLATRTSDKNQSVWLAMENSTSHQGVSTATPAVLDWCDAQSYQGQPSAFMTGSFVFAIDSLLSLMTV